MLCIYSWVWSHLLQCDQLSKALFLKKNRSSLPQKPSTTNSFSTGVAGNPPSMLEWLLAWSYAAVLQATVAVHWHTGSGMSRRHCFHLMVPDLWLLQSLCPLFHSAPWTCGEGTWCPICGWASMETNSLHLVQLRVSNSPHFIWFFIIKFTF